MLKTFLLILSIICTVVSVIFAANKINLNNILKKLFQFLISKSFWVNLTFVIILVLAGFFAVSLFLDSYTKHDEFVKVPEFEGFHYSEIDAFISDKDLRFEITDSIFDPKKSGGAVVEQIPNAGELVKPNRKIYLTINSVIPPSVLLPELRDITVRQVMSKIETYGLRVDSLVYKPAECDNCVIGVLYNGEEILPGERIVKGESISLVVGEGIGSERIPVPYLYAMALNQARSYLNEKGLNLGYFEYDTTVKTMEDTMNAFVFSQNPKYDTNNEVRQGQAFELFFTIDSNKIEVMELIVADSLDVGTDE